MSDLSDTIKGFYSDFILRDLLSFVTPGAIGVGTFIYALSNFGIGVRYIQPHFLVLINLIPIFGWILLFGLFYVVGIGLQLIREKIPGLEFPPIEYRNKYRRNDEQIKKVNDDLTLVNGKEEFIRTFGCDELFRNSKYYAEFRLPFIRKTQPIRERSFDAERKTEERFIVIMQASGNSAIAFSIAAITEFIVNFKDLSPIPVLIISILCIVSIILLKNFQLHRQRLLDWELEITNPHILSSRSFSRSHFRRRS
jgi:hypothetical protein